MNQKKLMDLVDNLIEAAREAGRCEIEEENGNRHSALDLADREVLELRERILQTLEGGNAQS
jgi:hypothetical protein